MISPRLKSHIRVSAILRRCQSAGVMATVARKGDEDAGTIFVKTYLGRDAEGAPQALLQAEGRDDAGEIDWRSVFEGPTAEAEIDDYLAKESQFDTDLWIIEIEDREGRDFIS